MISISKEQLSTAVLSSINELENSYKPGSRVSHLFHTTNGLSDPIGTIINSLQNNINPGGFDSFFFEGDRLVARVENFHLWLIVRDLLDEMVKENKVIKLDIGKSAYYFSEEIFLDRFQDDLLNELRHQIMITEESIKERQNILVNNLKSLDKIKQF